MKSPEGNTLCWIAAFWLVLARFKISCCWKQTEVGITVGILLLLCHWMSLGTLGTQNGTPVLPRNVLVIIIPSRNDGIRFFGRTFSKRKVEKWRTIKLEEWSKPTDSKRPHGQVSWFYHIFSDQETNVGTSASHWAHPLPCGPRCGTTFKARPRWRRVEINCGGELSPKKQDPPIHPNIYIYMCYIY